jgi:hypothetical protein
MSITEGLGCAWDSQQFFPHKCKGTVSAWPSPRALSSTQLCVLPSTRVPGYWMPPIISQSSLGCKWQKLNSNPLKHMEFAGLQNREVQEWILLTAQQDRATNDSSEPCCSLPTVLPSACQGLSQTREDGIIPLASLALTVPSRKKDKTF